MKQVTNYIVKSTAVNWRERYILPPFRTHMEELKDKMDELGYEPLVVIGPQGEWWNDDLGFILDRMSDGHCCRGDFLYAWESEILDHPLKEGETRAIECEGDTYSVTADTTDVSHGGRMTNDCEPVEEEK